MSDSLRQVTKMEFCDRHAPWFATNSVYRKLECMFEGGPGGWTPGCSGGQCRLWPGLDHCDSSVCADEFPLEWTEKPSPVREGLCRFSHA